MGLDSLGEWSPNLDGCLDQFISTARVCSSVGRQNSWLPRAGKEGGWKQLCTLAHSV